jgi:hypothetical protein
MSCKHMTLSEFHRSAWSGSRVLGRFYPGTVAANPGIAGGNPGIKANHPEVKASHPGVDGLHPGINADHRR